MASVEPNVIAAVVFTALATVISISVYMLIDAFPINRRVGFERRVLIYILIIVDLITLLAVVSGSALYATETLRWTTIVVVAGLAILFVPGMLNFWPLHWRDGIPGLYITLAGLIATLSLLEYSDVFPSTWW